MTINMTPGMSLHDKFFLEYYCCKVISCSDSRQNGGGRKGSTDAWYTAHHAPVVPTIDDIYQKCNSRCYLSGNCAKDISGLEISRLRKVFHGENIKEAPKDKERAQRILEYFKKARRDEKDNLIFKIGTKEVCLPTFLRFLGLSRSNDMRDAPGQWTRLLKGYINSLYDKEYLLDEEDFKLEAGEGYTTKEGHCTAFINDWLTYMSDAIPLEMSEDDDGNLISTMVVPFQRIIDFFAEYVYNCESADPPIPKGARAEIQTFTNAYNKLKDKKVIKLTTGKSGFPCCGQCNSLRSLKTTASRSRNTVTRDVLRKLARLHLLQQGTERQHAENFILESKKLFNGQPVQAYFNIDASSVWTGNSPKFQKVRNSKQNTHIENRNFGCRIVCGPIDEYISVCTNNLIPGGANVMVEVVRYCIEYLSGRLQEVGMVIPKKVGFHFDNSGENKVGINILI
jgi:hypothetical protein